MIGTARCAAFRERPGRLLSAQHLIEAGIDALIICGGDGSLTGADIFRSEWPSLVTELVDNKTITRERADAYKTLTIVGLVGSIDNDMALTDATIGAFSSLHRICESVDSISSTATSHSRAFVIEVMGRHCGWLALMAGISTGSDLILLPERPPEAGKWEDNMLKIIEKVYFRNTVTKIRVVKRENGKQLSLLRKVQLIPILTRSRLPISRIY